MMPIDLVLVRHGQSEGNLANRYSETGDNSLFTQDFRNRHSSSFRLSKLGVEQAIITGEWIKKEFFKNSGGFDRYFTSEYVRAMETASLMNLPNANWYRDVYLTERDWGQLDICPDNERRERFGEVMDKRIVQPFFWKPPNGESFVDLCLRIDRVLQTLHRECGDKKVLIVCHGEVMRAFQVRLERMSQARFKQLTFSKNYWDRIYNCEVIHYTRRNPRDNQLAKHLDWVRKIRPNEKDEGKVKITSWLDIKRETYSNEQLLSEVSSQPTMVG